MIHPNQYVLGLTGAVWPNHAFFREWLEHLAYQPRPFDLDDAILQAHAVEGELEEDYINPAP